MNEADALAYGSCFCMVANGDGDKVDALRGIVMSGAKVVEKIISITCKQVQFQMIPR